MLTVVTPATTRRLTTVANVRLDLGIDEATASDAQVERMIDQATSAIEVYCRRVFAEQTYRESYPRISSQERILLERGPVTEIVSVTSSGSLLLTTQFETEGGFLYRLGDFGRAWWPVSGLIVDYKAGYTLPGTPNFTLPGVIEQACIGEIAAQRSRRSRDPLIRSETEEGVGSTSWQIMVGSGPLAHPDSEGLLDEFRLVNLL